MPSGDVGVEPVDDGASVGEPARAGQRHDGVQVVEHVPRLVLTCGSPTLRRAARSGRPRRRRRGAAATAGRWRRASRGARPPSPRCGRAGRRSSSDSSLRPASSRYRARCHQLWTVNRLPSAQSACGPAKEADPLVDPALHLVDVRHDGVGGPHVAAVAVERGEPVVFGQLVVARSPRARRRTSRARSRGAGAPGRSPAASGRPGRAGWRRRRGRSRAGGRRAGRAGRRASGPAGRRGGGRRRASRPASHVVDRGAVGALTFVEGRACRGGRRSGGRRPGRAASVEVSER